jgi:hypothetical protein
MHRTRATGNDVRIHHHKSGVGGDPPLADEPWAPVAQGHPGAEV